MPVNLPFTVYQDQLTALSHGLALWNPSPQKKIYDNVSIGDVGYLHEGTFIRLFNVTLPWDHPSNQKLGRWVYHSLGSGPLTIENFDKVDSGPLTIEVNFDKVDHCSHFVSAVSNASSLHASTPEE